MTCRTGSAIPGWPPGPGCSLAPRMSRAASLPGHGRYWRGAGPEPGDPHQPQHGAVPNRVRPAGVRGGRPGAGGAAGRGGRRPPAAGSAAGVAGAARGEADLVAQVRQAQGAVRFDEVFAAGSRLSQRGAVAAIRGRRRPACSQSAGSAFSQPGWWRCPSPAPSLQVSARDVTALLRLARRTRCGPGFPGGVYRPPGACPG